MSLRKILGGSNRVKKSSKGTGAKRPPSSSSSSSWTAALPRTKASSSAKKSKKATQLDDDEDDDLFGDKLDDYGLVKALAADLALRDTSQAIRYIRNHMFSPLPEQAAGMNSTRIADVLNYRKRLPPIVTVAHVQALLSSPSAVEREIAELARSGFLRRIVVPRRGDIGETVMLASDYGNMIQTSASLDQSVRESFLAYLQANTGAQMVKRAALREKEIEQLIRAGFLTAHHTGIVHHGSMSHTMSTYSRPEDKSTLTSLANVSRQAAGSLGAVGGDGALHNAGGSGGGSGSGAARTTYLDTGATELKLAVPGNGTFLKLLSAALDHLVSLTARSQFREASEGVLRDRWDGGVAKEEARYAAKRSRGEFAGILPGQTRKWRQFYGLSFDWVLQEAVGSGLVEVFETRSVGRGIRAL